MKTSIRILTIIAVLLTLNGCATGAAAGGLIGDEQSRQWYEDQYNAYPQGRRHYRPPYRDDYPNWQDGGFGRPCARVAVPVYDSYGYLVGRRIVCR